MKNATLLKIKSVLFGCSLPMSDIKRNTTHVQQISKESFLKQLLFIVLLTFLYSTIGYSQTVGVLGTTAAQFSDATSVTSNTLSNFSVPCGTNRILVVRTNGTPPTSVTFAGTALTFIRRDQISIVFGVNFFYLPLGSDCATCTSTGTSGATTGDIVVMHPSSGSVGIIATVLENVDQTNPIRDQVGSGGSTGFSPSTGGFFTLLPLTGLQAGDGILDYAGMNFTDFAGTHGAANYSYFGMTSGATDVISSTTSDEKVAAFLPVTGNGSVTPSWNQLIGKFEFHYVGAVAFAHAASNCPEGLASLTAPAVVVTNNSCPSTTGTIAVPTTCCPKGSTIEYSINSGTSWNTTLPTYDASMTQTILSRCKCDADASVVSQQGMAATSPNSCCPSLTAAAPVAVISAQSTCTVIGGTPSGGVIAAPTTACPTGSTLMYSTDGTNFSSTLPIYNQTTAQTITTRCDCGTNMSPTSMVTTAPMTCPLPNPNPVLVVRNYATNEPSILDPCFCGNPLNVVDSGTGLVTRFHDYAEITDNAGEVWRLTAVNSGDVLTQNGTAIPLNTALTYDPATGTYHLDLYHFPNSGFNASFTRDRDGFVLSTGGSCSPCPSPIPTMSEWGLMIFGLLVLNMSVVFLRRREGVETIA